MTCPPNGNGVVQHVIANGKTFHTLPLSSQHLPAKQMMIPPLHDKTERQRTQTHFQNIRQTSGLKPPSRWDISLHRPPPPLGGDEATYHSLRLCTLGQRTTAFMSAGPPPAGNTLLAVLGRGNMSFLLCFFNIENRRIITSTRSSAAPARLVRWLRAGSIEVPRTFSGNQKQKSPSIVRVG